MIRYITTLAFCICLLAIGCTEAQSPDSKNTDVQRISDYISDKDYDQYGVATFAGGCFWCTEASFECIQGVVDVISGYSGGEKAYPTYEEVSYKRTKHAEAIQIYYDKQQITYDKLLDIFFVAHDPTQLNRQGPDVGPQYRSAIYYRTEEEKQIIEKKIKKLNASGKFDKPIVTEVTKYDEFWTAEGYHQDYYEHNPGNPYIQKVSKPKVEKVKKTFGNLLKAEYKN